MVAIGRAMMPQPTMLLEEPTEGLAPSLSYGLCRR